MHVGQMVFFFMTTEEVYCKEASNCQGVVKPPYTQGAMVPPPSQGCDDMECQFLITKDGHKKPEEFPTNLPNDHFVKEASEESPCVNRTAGSVT